ncbi:MAG: lipid-A-disaccharide synthase [Armatimonadota bacterium]
MTRRVVIVSGEASGDLYGADLARHLQAQVRSVEIRGVGGVRMREAGVHLIADSRAWGAIGIIESLKVAPRVWRVFLKVKRILRDWRPDLLVPIDFGAFNIPLCRWAKSRGIPVIYYMPPSSWRRDRQGQDLPNVTDVVLTPFPWSAEILQAMGAQAVRVRHPLLRLTHPNETKITFCQRLGLDPDRPIVALLPGSRHHEVRALTTLYARVANILTERVPEVQFVLSVAPHFQTGYLHGLWADGQRQWVPTETRPVADMLAHADCAVICSGTATLEAALLGTPMLIVYRGDTLMSLEYRLRRRRLALEMIGLPNLILGRKVIPEKIQEAANPHAVSKTVLELLQRGELYHQQKQAFQEIRRTLGEGEDLWEAPAWIAHYLTESIPVRMD